MKNDSSKIEKALLVCAKIHQIASIIGVALIFLCFVRLAIIQESFLLFAAGSLVSAGCAITWYFGYWLICGFAEVVKNSAEIKNSIKFAFKDNIEHGKSEEKRVFEEKERIRKAEEEKLRLLAEQAEQERKAKFQAYWMSHAEERKALLEKKKEAELKLKELGSLASDERKILTDLIQAIDEELTKER